MAAFFLFALHELGSEDGAGFLVGAMREAYFFKDPRMAGCSEQLVITSALWTAVMQTNVGAYCTNSRSAGEPRLG